MVITTYDKKEYFVSDAAGAQLQEAAQADPRPEFLDLYGDGRDVIATKNISGFHKDSTYDGLSLGPGPKELPPYKHSEHQEQWYKILQLNKKRLNDFGGPYKRVRVIRSTQELEEYERTGVWPE